MTMRKLWKDGMPYSVIISGEDIRDTERTFWILSGLKNWDWKVEIFRGFRTVGFIPVKNDDEIQMIRNDVEQIEFLNDL